MAKILILDIETAPKVAYVWRFWKENISPKQVLDHGHIMSFACKWLNEPGMFYYSNEVLTEQELVETLLEFLDKADIVVAHNGKKFDLGTIKARAMVHGLMPPSPYKIVDTLLVARSQFLFESNSLAYLAKVLNCTEKEEHKKFPGFELWLEVLRNNPEAWEELAVYNKQDVATLEEVYLKMRPWITNHPNVSLYKDVDGTECPKCGSDDIHFRGYVNLIASRYRRFCCNDCGGWGRLRINELPKARRKALAANIAG